MGCSLKADAPWRWFHPRCECALIDIQTFGQTDVDDAMGAAVAATGWEKAAALRNDMGDPQTLRPLELDEPKRALSKLGPADRGALLMALTVGFQLKAVCTATGGWPALRVDGAGPRTVRPITI